MQFSAATLLPLAVFATSIAAAPAEESSATGPEVPTPTGNFCLPPTECVAEEPDDCPWDMVPAQEQGCWTCCFVDLPSFGDLEEAS